MGTRGSYGFYKNGVSKLTYNHWDSYPSGLGDEVLKFIKDTEINDINDIFESLILVDRRNYPTKEEKMELEKQNYGYIYRGEELKWDAILGHTIGDLLVYKSGLKYMLEYNDFIQNSLYCEWAYIINLDDETLEVYKGFQKVQNDNRYSIKTPVNNKYYACKLIKVIPISKINEIDSLDDLDY